MVYAAYLEKTRRRKKRSLGTFGSGPEEPGFPGIPPPDLDFETNAKFLVEFMTLDPEIRKNIGHKLVIFELFLLKKVISHFFSELELPTLQS